jgi:ParB-like chromosome segregation protein Spo0J
MGENVAGARLSVGSSSASWPAAKIVKRRLSQLKPAPRNARQHSERQIEQLVASFKRWGWTMPVLVDEGSEIIAGHGRVEAAKRLGITVAPTVVARGWTDEQKRAYAIADNKLPLNATWDDELLSAELIDLSSVTSMVELGFSTAELARLLKPIGEAAAPQLGNALEHRIIVECKSETHQAELLERFEREGLKCRPLIS